VANEVTIVVKSRDNTDFTKIGEKARTSMKKPLEDGLDDVDKTTRERFYQIGDYSGRTLSERLDEHLKTWSTEVGDKVQGPLKESFEHATEEIDVKVKTKFKEVGDHSGRSLASGLEGSLGGIAGVGSKVGDEFGKEFSKAGSEAGGEIASLLWPVIIAAIVGLAPAAGALLAAGIVLAFGAGLAGLGLAASFHLKPVKKEFAGFTKDLKSFAKDISKPFEGTWKTIFDTAGKVMKTFQGPLKSAMKDFIAPATSRFVENLGKAFEQLAPAIKPMSKAFADLMDAIGPRLPGVFKSISDALIGIANTISDNPDLFADLIVGIIQLIPLALKLVGALSKVFTWLGDHRKGLEQAGKMFMGLVSPLGMAAVAFHKIEDAAKKAWDIISKFGGKGIHFVLSAVNKVDGPAKAAIKAAKGFAHGVYRAALTAHETATAVVHIAEAVAKRFAHGTYRAALTAHNAVHGAVNAAISACRGFARRTYRAVLSARNAVASALRSAINMGNQWAGRVFTATFNVLKSINPFNAHGGIIGGLATGGMPRGMAGGGPGGSLTWVGEQGAELVRLPTGSQVYPHGQSKGMAARMGGGGAIKLELEWVGGNAGDKLMTWLKENIRIRAGSGPDSVQRALG
jgi:phage-related protein